MHHHTLINALKASQNWINQFNHGNLDYCAGSYTEDAILEVAPLGLFAERAQIRGFWEGMLQSGAHDLFYLKTRVELVDDDEVCLSGEWRMNNARGRILEERWQRQGDGHWKQVAARLEITEQL